MTCTNRSCPRVTGRGQTQGQNCPCSLEASRRCLGITGDPMESSTVRWFAVLMAVVALCAVAERLL